MARDRIFVVSARISEDTPREIAFEIPEPWLASVLEGTEYAPEWGTTGEFAIEGAPVAPGCYVTGAIEVHLSAECVRCLRPARIDLEVPFKVHMSPGPAAAEEESIGEDGSLGAGHYQGEEFVLDSLVRESLILALPMNPRCPGGCTVEDLYRDEEN